jgi:hypothetical protein
MSYSLFVTNKELYPEGGGSSFHPKRHQLPKKLNSATSEVMMYEKENRFSYSLSFAHRVRGVLTAYREVSRP